MADLSKLSDEELDELAIDATKRRTAAELEAKEEQRAIGKERSRRANRLRLAAVLDGLPEDERDELVAEIGG